MPISEQNFLSAHKLHEDVYITGMFYSGITIYNQQVRTLNLIYFLNSNNLLPTPRESHKRPIVIIGAGVSGLTAAIALKKLKYHVRLIEEKSLLLHLQHGCSTRQIHPNLYLWPQLDAQKPFTELPFANWEAADAATIERQLVKEFKKIQTDNSGGAITVSYNIFKPQINLSKKEIFWNGKKGNPIGYSLVLLATGFGLENFVDKREKTKSYWRNEDFGQLRLSNQVRNFLISGTGDGGISDSCRLSLIAFDPLAWAKKFEAITKKSGRLIDELRNLEKGKKRTKAYNYFQDFNRIFSKFENEITLLIQKNLRKDITSVILNGKDLSFENILKKNRMSFINAWLIFILNKMDIIKYHSGAFPNECGEYLMNYEDENKNYTIIIRHGTDKNWSQFKALNSIFSQNIKPLEQKQKLKSYNDFSTQTHWELEFWNKTNLKYAAKLFVVSKKTESTFAIFLDALNGLIQNFIREKYPQKPITYRATLHRLISHSQNFFFQQVSEYVGTFKKNVSDLGRAFPINHGLVGHAMRTNTCFSLATEKKEKNLFDYSKIAARTLPKNTDGFFLLPFKSVNEKASVLCLYFDTSERTLVTDKNFRKLIYWTFTSFIQKLGKLNVSEVEITKTIGTRKELSKTLNVLTKTPGLQIHNDEINQFVQKDGLRFSDNRLIDIYEK